MSSELSSVSFYYTPPKEKWCPGCEQFLSVDLFGVNNSLRSKISSRCRKCNVEKSKKSNERCKRKSLSMNIPKPPKPLYKELKMHPPYGTIKKYCPSCHREIWLCPEMKEGHCYGCEKDFTVKHRLSRIQLIKMEEKKDYKSDILKIISENNIWIAALARKMNLSEGKTKYELDKLEKEGRVYKIEINKRKYLRIRSL